MCREKNHENIIPFHFEVLFRARPSSEDLCQFMFTQIPVLKETVKCYIQVSQSRCAKFL